jgi:hypothetical protein
VCTSIVVVVSADGAGKRDAGWFAPDSLGGVLRPSAPCAVGGGDNHRFLNSALGPDARVAVEQTLRLAKEVSRALAWAIVAAENEERGRSRTLYRGYARSSAFLPNTQAKMVTPWLWLNGASISSYPALRAAKNT